MEMKRIYTLIILLGLYATVCAQVSTQNYVRTRTMLDEGGSSYMDNVVYYDGLGRPFQTVQKGITPVGKKNLITLQEYDVMGREGDAWLPIKSDSVYLQPATFKTSAPGNYSNDARPYSQPVYESSPLNRVVERYGPGYSWRTSPTTTGYLTNTLDASLRCKHYQVSADGGLTLSAATYYSAGELYVTKNADEDKHVSYTFTDKDGRILLTRKMASGVGHDTYSVYDDLGNLCYVLQPMYQDNSSLSLYAFQYKYDDRGRCIWKKMPGSDYVENVYDDADRLLFSQDGRQRASGNKWTFYQYDSFSRLTCRGECVNKNTTDVHAVIYIQNYYDNYGFLKQSGFTNRSHFTVGDTLCARSLPTGSIVSVLDNASKIYSANYYDTKGRLVKNVKNNLLGGYDTSKTTYTFTGKPLAVTHIHTASGKTTLTEVYTYTYDNAERLTKTDHTLNGVKVTLASNTYDEFGCLSTKSLHGASVNRLLYSYNIRNWLTFIYGNKFKQTLDYENTSGRFTKSCFNGNISSMTWKAGNDATFHGYNFLYDGFNRLEIAVYGENADINKNGRRYDEMVSYDKNGNVKTLERHGQTGTNSYGVVDQLTMKLNGNRLSRVDDSSTATAVSGGTDFRNGTGAVDGFAYDVNGNLTKDLSKDIVGIQYNVLNLPSRVIFRDNSAFTYIYAADGRKLRTLHNIKDIGATQTDYCDNVIYENSIQKLLLTEEGYVSLPDKKYHYYLKDHQGNNRVVVDKDGNVEETTHYYPFGGVFASTGSVQPYKYNGKELDTKKGLNWHDYGVRHYDAALGRWHVVDPLAEKYYGVSPYTYCKNNPTNGIDPDGKLVIFINGFHNGFVGGSSVYWRMNDKPVNFTTAVMAHFGDWNERYYDGALGGTLGFSQNMLCQNRYDIGYVAGLKDAKEIISQLARDANGNIVESIKVISHSMVGAYAKGFLQALVQYVRNHPEECNGISLSEYDFAPFQPGSQKAVKGVDTYQYSHLKDNVAHDAPIEGATQMPTVVDEEKGHSIADYYEYINTLPAGKYIFENGEFVSY